MATVKVYFEFRAIVNGELRVGGSRVSSADLSVAGEVYEATTIVADDYNLETVWVAGDGGLDDFDFLWVEATEDVLLQLIHDKDGTPKYQVHEVKAGVPFILSGDDVQNTEAADDTEQSSLDQIDQIDVHRNAADDAGDATVRLVLIS